MKTLSEKNKENVKLIEEAYAKVHRMILFKPINKATRKIVSKNLMKELSFLDEVICNEENNPPEVIDSGMINAKLIWNKDKPPHPVGGYDYLDISFS